MKDDVIVIIPAYNPDEKLEKTISDLKKNQYINIIVINDGSTNNKVFDRIKKQVKVLKHAQNKGKGEALKTGISYCLKTFSDKIGIITVDADGQHLIEDINKIYFTFHKHKNSVILGCRNFKEKKVPFSSKAGNLIFRYLLKQKTKLAIKDTQTGLRALPFYYLKELLLVNGERYEYETNVLIDCIQKKIPILEVDITTVYIDKNQTSHFNKMRDSLNILKTVLKNKD